MLCTSIILFKNMNRLDEGDLFCCVGIWKIVLGTWRIKLFYFMSLEETVQIEFDKFI